MIKNTGFAKKILDSIEELIDKKMDESSTKTYHQYNTFEGGLYGGARSLTDVSTGSEEAHLSVVIKSGTVGL
jgi:hypothetical protein